MTQNTALSLTSTLLPYILERWQIPTCVPGRNLPVTLQPIPHRRREG